MPLPKPDYLTLREAMEYISERCNEPLDTVRTALTRALHDMAFLAVGYWEDGRNRTICSKDWYTADIDENGDRVFFHNEAGGMVFDRIEINRHHIDDWLSLAIAPTEECDAATSEKIQQSSAATSTAGAKTSCRHWLIELMQDQAGPTKSKTEYRVEAEGQWSGLSVRGFNDAWSAAIMKTGNEKWSKPGRKS